MKNYRFNGSHTTLTDDEGEIFLNKPGQIVTLDEDRAARHIAAGAPLTEVPAEKENDADASPIE
jgi:hypothetical protein